MSLDAYRLLSPLGAGRDGTAYQAETRADGSPVEVRLLDAARADAARWKSVARRLRLAALVTHPVALRLRELEIAAPSPFVVLDVGPEATLAEALRGRLPLRSLEGLTLANDLAGVLATAHLQGTAHGRLCPSQIRLTSSHQLALDFTGLDVVSSTGNHESRCDTIFRPPEPSSADQPTPAADLFALGALLQWLFTGQTLPDRAPLAPHELQTLVAELLAGEPSARPSAADCQRRLARLLPRIEMTGAFEVPAEPSPSMAATVAGKPAAPAPTEEEGLPVDHLGRFRLQEKLGQGGMGAVYRAIDPADGSTVAIKVLRAAHVGRPDLLRRFHKEARLLAEVNNPYVTNLLEVNEDGGIHYLVLEYVAGQSLGKRLESTGPLPEREALALLADVCRGLVEAHQRGIVHRDIKPDNILLQRNSTGGNRENRETNLKDISSSSPASSSSLFPLFPPVQFLLPKLADFGLARHVVESESLNVTQAGAIMGTPPYMAPEQFTGDAVDPRTDVYALGVTLYHMLAGKPPFQGATFVALMGQHRNETPPPLQKLTPEVSDGACQVVEKALAKAPQSRYADAGALLRDLERLLRGEPAHIAVHPRPPECDPARLLVYDWEWDLEASPRQLWPHVSNTERFNRAAGLTAVQFTTEPDPAGGTRRFGQFRRAGITAAWREHPFEWVEGRRFGVLREYSQGPFKWLMSVVELTPRADGGTRLAHRVRIEPHGLLGRTIAAVEVAYKGRRAVETVYRRIDAAVTGKLGNPALADPFDPPLLLSPALSQRLAELIGCLIARGIAPHVAERLGEYLEQVPAQEAARIRPLALARRLGLDADAVVSACLHGAREGLFVLLWDIICPICRIPSQVEDTLRALKEHGNCPACRRDFELDFGSSVELIFRLHPELRPAELATYCVGGPAHSPHVVAQARLAPRERLELDLALTEGAYRLRGPQLPYVLDFRVLPTATVGHWELDLARAPSEGPVLRVGAQVLAVTSNSDCELVVRVERAAARFDALTAARASSLALFRELFPGETLQPGQLVRLATMTFLVTDLERSGDLYADLGDARAFALLHDLFRAVADQARREGGALVKTIGEGALAAFNEPTAAVRAALALPTGRGLRTAVHRGPAMAATLNDHLDYFGATVKQAAELVRCAHADEVVLGPSVAGDAQVLALLAREGRRPEPLTADLSGAPGSILHRVSRM